MCRHIRTQHQDTTAARYQCSHCKFSTKISSHLKRHERIHTGSKPYKCPHCSYVSNNPVSHFQSPFWCCKEKDFSNVSSFLTFSRRICENTLSKAKNIPAVSCTNANCVQMKLNHLLQTTLKNTNVTWWPFTRRKVIYKLILE